MVTLRDVLAALAHHARGELDLNAEVLIGFSDGTYLRVDELAGPGYGGSRGFVLVASSERVAPSDWSTYGLKL